MKKFNKMRRTYIVFILIFICRVLAQDIGLQNVNLKITSAECGRQTCDNLNLKFCNSYDTACVSENCVVTYDFAQSATVNVGGNINNTVKLFPWSNKGRFILPIWIIVHLSGPSISSQQFCLPVGSSKVQDDKMMLNISIGNTLKIKFEIWSTCDQPSCTYLECKCESTTTTSTQSSALQSKLPKSTTSTTRQSSISTKPSSMTLSTGLSSKSIKPSTGLSSISIKPSTGLSLISIKPSTGLSSVSKNSSSKKSTGLLSTSIKPSTSLSSVSMKPSMKSPTSLSSIHLSTKPTTALSSVSMKPSTSLSSISKESSSGLSLISVKQPIDLSSTSLKPSTKLSKSSTSIVPSRQTLPELSFEPTARFPFTNPTTLENSTETSLANDGAQSGSKKSWIYVGAGIGAVTVVLVLVILFVFRYKRSKRRKEAEERYWEYEKEFEHSNNRGEDFYAGHNRYGQQEHYELEC